MVLIGCGRDNCGKGSKDDVQITVPITKVQKKETDSDLGDLVGEHEELNLDTFSCETFGNSGWKFPLTHK